MRDRWLIACVSAGVLGAAFSYADPQGEPLFTFCEVEDNDRCERAQLIDADVANTQTDFFKAEDCFFITGKLQKDCAWDCEPKTALVAYNKPQQCFDDDGDPIPQTFAEPIIAESFTGELNDIAPLSDRTLRLGVAATTDAFDGTINGLASNGRHGQRGKALIKLFYDDPGGGETRGSSPDATYEVCFQDGGDAFRIAFIIPQGVSTVDVVSCESVGQVEICWDTDFYEITNLKPNRPYCITGVGGLTKELFGIRLPFCFKTPLQLGEFDKKCQLLQTVGTEIEILRRPPFIELGPFPDLCLFADDTGTIRLGVSSILDRNFNGINDIVEPILPFLQLLLFFDFDLDIDWVGGSSLKDSSASDVNRLPRELWRDGGLRDAIRETISDLLDEIWEMRYAANCVTTGDEWSEERFRRFVDRIISLILKCDFPLEFFMQHFICGEYCLKVRLADHVDSDDEPVIRDDNRSMAERTDMDYSGTVDAADLATLLGFWGPVQ